MPTTSNLNLIPRTITVRMALFSIQPQGQPPIQHQVAILLIPRKLLRCVDMIGHTDTRAPGYGYAKMLQYMNIHLMTQRMSTIQMR